LAKETRRHLSEEQIKIHVLAYLYNKGEIGANAYVIQHRANIPSQEGSRFRGFLEDLCKLGSLKDYEVETGGEKVRVNYKITMKGKEVVERYRNPLLQELFGSIEKLFEPRD
jgi:predicted transcriptional regulator